MITYQDYLKISDSDDERMKFVLTVIEDHKHSQFYEIAKTANEYAKHLNTTIVEFQKLLYTVSGKAIPDNFSANYKLSSGFFPRFISQQTQFLLGNGVSWTKADTEKKLGADFDTMLQKAGKMALIGGVSYGFFNLDHMDVFSALEFAPLYDEENGAIMAGVRFWQLNKMKPIRATFYEMDGYTEYIWKDGKGEVLAEKRAYK